MYLIKNVSLYTPEYAGIKDILFSDRVEMIKERIACDLFETIDGTGMKLIPGLIDGHVHVTGGGGEGSFRTKAPEIQLSSITKAGVTTVLGLLGTDGVSRNSENLVSKVKALREEGISAYALSGSYLYPPCTITGSVRNDMLFVDEIIGCKMALSDHRSSYITKEELSRLGADVRTPGLLSGKAGIVVLHMGDDPSALKLVFDILKETELPVTVFHPTHVNRNPYLMEDAYHLLEMGGYIDVSAGNRNIDLLEVLDQAKKRNLPLNRITVSSDAQGSWSLYDEEGHIKGIGIMPISLLWDEFRMLLDHGYAMEDALPYFTCNTADSLCLKHKGRIIEGNDADFVLVNEHNEIDSVIAHGRFHIRNGQQLIKGTFE